MCPGGRYRSLGAACVKHVFEFFVFSESVWDGLEWSQEPPRPLHKIEVIRNLTRLFYHVVNCIFYNQL
jgi:hypothetical protein